MIDTNLINAQQTERNRIFRAWLEDLDAEFAKAEHNPKIELYFPDRNVPYEVQPVQAHVTYPPAGSGRYGLTLYHAQTWRDLKAAVDLILWRIKVT